MYDDINRTGAFVVATPKHVAIAARRTEVSNMSGYATWQVNGLPVIIASPPLPGQISQDEFCSRVNALVRIHRADSIEDVVNCIKTVVDACPPSEEEEARQFEYLAGRLAERVVSHANIFRADLISQDYAGDWATCIQAVGKDAIQGYIRGYYVTLKNVTKEALSDRYIREAYRAFSNALKPRGVEHELILSMANAALDEIMSYRLSVDAKRFIVSGFSRLEPRVASVDLDGFFLGSAKMNITEHWIPFAEKQSFFLDAGDCYEAGRFARGLNTDAQMQSFEVTQKLLSRVEKKGARMLGKWRNLSEIKPSAADVATLALKMAEFNGSGLFGMPLHKLVENATPSELASAMRVLCEVTNLQDKLLGVTCPSMSHITILGPGGVISQEYVCPAQDGAAASKKKKAA